MLWEIRFPEITTRMLHLTRSEHSIYQHSFVLLCFIFPLFCFWRVQTHSGWHFKTTGNSKTSFLLFRVCIFWCYPITGSWIPVAAVFSEGCSVYIQVLNQPAFQVSPQQTVSFYLSPAHGWSFTILSFSQVSVLLTGSFLWVWWTPTLALLLPFLQETERTFPSILGPLPCMATLLDFPVHSLSSPWGMLKSLSTLFLVRMSCGGVFPTRSSILPSVHLPTYSPHSSMPAQKIFNLAPLEGFLVSRLVGGHALIPKHSLLCCGVVSSPSLHSPWRRGMAIWPSLILSLPTWVPHSSILFNGCSSFFGRGFHNPGERRGRLFFHIWGIPSWAPWFVSLLVFFFFLTAYSYRISKQFTKELLGSVPRSMPISWRRILLMDSCFWPLFNSSDKKELILLTLLLSWGFPFGPSITTSCLHLVTRRELPA